ncbi:hypothetical protein [Pedobacter panaciterrae]
MKSLKFAAAFGDEDRNVEIGQVSGSIGLLHIYVDNYFAGSINCVLGKWVVHWVVPTDRSVLQEYYLMDDSEAILDHLINAGWIENNHNI